MFTEDVTVFFDPAAFAKAATLTVGTTVTTPNVIFDDAYVDPLGAFESRAPVAWLPVADAGAVAQGSTLVVDGTTYTVVEVLPDGSGNVLQLRLRG
jgi:hypothetical protein